MMLPARKSLRMVERDRDRWMVKEMLYTDEFECETIYNKILKALVED